MSTTIKPSASWPSAALYGNGLGEVLVVSNTVSGNTGAGIAVWENVAVRDNVVFNNSDGIIQEAVNFGREGGFVATDNTIADNRVFGNTNVGIRALVGSIVINNDVYSNAVGIQGTNYSDFNPFANLPYHGTIQNNLVYGNSDVGILIKGATDGTVANNLVYRQLQCGHPDQGATVERSQQHDLLNSRRCIRVDPLRRTCNCTTTSSGPSRATISTSPTIAKRASTATITCCTRPGPARSATGRLISKPARLAVRDRPGPAERDGGPEIPQPSRRRWDPRQGPCDRSRRGPRRRLPPPRTARRAWPRRSRFGLLAPACARRRPHQPRRLRQYAEATTTASTGAIVNQTDGSTDVVEGGLGDLYTVVLTSPPTDNVTVTLTPDSQLIVSPTTLTFTPENWNAAQAVSVKAPDDHIVEGYRSVTIAQSASSSDPRYNGLAIPSVTVHIKDDETTSVALVAAIAAITPDPRNTAVSTVEVVFSTPINSSTFTTTAVSLMRDGNAVPLGGLTISVVSGTTYRVSGLEGFTATAGTYVLQVDVTKVKDLAGEAGTGVATDTLGMDTTRPTATVVAVAPDPSTTAVSTVDVVFSEPIDLTTFSSAVVSLNRDGSPVTLERPEHQRGCGQHLPHQRAGPVHRDARGLRAAGGSDEGQGSGRQYRHRFRRDSWVMAVPDTTSPNASLVAPEVNSSGGISYTFTVTYTDNVAVRVATLDNSDIVVSGPNNYSQAATFVSVDTNSDGTSRAATYRITPPSGIWDSTDNGIYTVTMQANQVSDASGNGVTPGALGTFAVSTGTILYWTNPRQREDVSDDGFISPIDALLVINVLNSIGGHKLPTPPTPDDSPPPYFDVTGDESVSPLDALIVINYLNRGGGEGEAGDTATSAIAATTWWPMAANTEMPEVKAANVTADERATDSRADHSRPSTTFLQSLDLLFAKLDDAQGTKTGEPAASRRVTNTGDLEEFLDSMLNGIADEEELFAAAAR